MIDLKGMALAGESAKQAKIGLAGLQTILSIGPVTAAEWNS